MKKILKKAFEEYLEFHNEELKIAQDLIENEVEFKTSEISVDSDLSEFNLKHVLYYFEIPDELEKTAEELCNIISSVKLKNKKKKDEFKLPQVNLKNAFEKDNRVLYVGKSAGKFSTRLKQHLGGESKKTYALHLKEWNKMFKTDKLIKLKLHYISFESLIKDGNKSILELIETSLHYKLKPILGRTGH